MYVAIEIYKSRVEARFFLFSAYFPISRMQMRNSKDFFASFEAATNPVSRGPENCGISHTLNVFNTGTSIASGFRGKVCRT